MAQMKNTILEAGNGSVGPIVVYSMYGKSYMRTKPARYKDKQSLAQLTQRQKMKMMLAYLSPFKELLRFTFASDAIGRSAFQAALSYNLRQGLEGEYPHQLINKQTALLSHGQIDLPSRLSVSRLSDGLLFEWDDSNNGFNNSTSDTLVVILQVGDTSLVEYRFTGVARCEGQFKWETAQVKSGKSLHVWMAFRNARETQMSNSFYLQC